MNFNHRKMLFLVIVAFLLANADAKFWKDCGSEESEVQTVSVSGCADAAKECAINQNSSITLSTVFKPNTTVNNLNASVEGNYGITYMMFKVSEPDVCKELSCPLKEGENATYNTTVAVPDIEAKGDIEVFLHLTNGNSTLACIEIKARIK